MKTNREILIAAARMSNPWGGSERVSFDPEDAARIAAVLRANKFSFLALKANLPETINFTPFENCISSEELLFRKLRNEYDRVREELASAGINTILLKSCGLFPSFPHLFSNLDVLVERARGDEARKLLHELGYAELVNTEEPNKFLFRFFSTDEFSFTFHLHEEVGWGVPFVSSREIWNNARFAQDDPELVIPGPREALLITLAHWFYEDKELSLTNLYNSAAALRSLGVPLKEAARGAARRGWEDGFFFALKIFNETWRKLFEKDFLSEADLKAVDNYLSTERMIRHPVLRRSRYLEGSLARVPFAANKLVYYRKILRDTSRTSIQRGKDVVRTLLWAVRWKFHIKSQKPILIALSGCDGSGKTVQATMLQEVFSTCDIRSRVIWARGGSSRFVSFFTSLAKGIRKGGDEPASENAREEAKVQYRRKALENPLLRFLYACLYSLDLCWIYVVRSRIYAAAGNAVICDRYIADAVVDFSVSSGDSVERLPFALRMLKALAPKPQLSFLLDVEAKEALRRKPEEGASEHLQRARESFKAYARKNAMLIMDADLSIGEVHKRIARDSLALFFKRYHTVINALLQSNPDQINPGRWRP